MSTTLLDTLNSNESISTYIHENNTDRGTPSLLKFITSEKKDYNITINGNKHRAIKDNVTDAFVETFFTNDDNITKMLVDYQYHFIHSKLMGDINREIMLNPLPQNRRGQSINSNNLYPLKHNEHIILNFKGGSTMYYLFKNIISNIHLPQDDIDRIKNNFKISDIDLSLTIESEESTRYYQLESVVTHLVIKYLEELTNRFECILLKTITNNSPEINELIRNNRYINQDNLLEMNLIRISNPYPNHPIYQADRIYELKQNINKYKLYFNPRLVLENGYDINIQQRISNEILELYREFIDYDNTDPESFFTFKTLDLLELSLLLEFMTHNALLKYVDNNNHIIPIFHHFHTMTLLYINKTKTFINYLLNHRYNYLLNNLYNQTKLSAFVRKINDNLIALNDTLKTKAISSYTTENTKQLFRPRHCNHPIINTPQGNYYNEYKYLYEHKSGTTSYYNIKTNDHIIPANINIEGRANFALIPQDNSYYPYLLVSTNNIGADHTSITNFKQGLRNVRVNLNNIDKNFDYTTNRNNVHYVALNKSIMSLTDHGFLLSFNLCRIKFNITLSDIIEQVNIEDENCPLTDINSHSVPSEFLDVSITCKFDSFHHITKEIEENNKGMIFNFSMPPEFEYGRDSRIMSYNLKTFAADLNNVLFNQQKIPWLDNKYSKRLIRLMFYLFNVQHQHFMENQVENISSKITNQINILDTFITSLDHTNFTSQNIINGNNSIITRIQRNSTQPYDFNIVTSTFISHLSIDNSVLPINSDNVIDIISSKKISEYLMLKSIYKYGDGFYTYTIMYIMIINKLNIDMNNARNNNSTPDDITKIINTYANIIKELYIQSESTYDVSYYGNIGDGTDETLVTNATNRMNLEIVSNFIYEVGIYIKNIQDNIGKLRPIFTENLTYTDYVFIPV